MSDAITDDNGTEWITTREAARRLPSTRPGKRTHINTIHRLIQTGRLEARVRISAGRRFWYVSASQVATLAQLQAAPREQPRLRSKREQAAADRATDEILRRAGIR